MNLLRSLDKDSLATVAALLALNEFAPKKQRGGSYLRQFSQILVPVNKEALLTLASLLIMDHAAKARAHPRSRKRSDLTKKLEKLLRGGGCGCELTGGGDTTPDFMLTERFTLGSVFYALYRGFKYLFTGKKSKKSKKGKKGGAGKQDSLTSIRRDLRTEVANAAAPHMQLSGGDSVPATATHVFPQSRVGCMQGQWDACGCI